MPILPAPAPHVVTAATAGFTVGILAAAAVFARLDRNRREGEEHGQPCMRWAIGEGCHHGAVTTQGGRWRCPRSATRDPDQS